MTEPLIRETIFSSFFFGLGVRVRAIFGAAVAAAAVLLTTPSVGSSSVVPGRCCFRVAIDVYYQLSLDYLGEADGAFTGSADVGGGWSTRFIADYTGQGLSVGGQYGDALVSSDQAWSANYDVLSNPPGTPPKASQHVSCLHFAGSYPTNHEHWGASTTSPFDRVPAGGGLANAVKNANGYPRGLQVADPAAGGVRTCPLLDGPAYFGLSWSPVTVKAPSVDNFLAGRRFSRVCARGVSGEPNHPFLHTYDGYRVAVVRFTYFPRTDLASNQRALDTLDGTKPGLSDAGNDAVNDLINGNTGRVTNTSSCS